MSAKQSLSCVWNANGSFTCDKICHGVICKDAYEYFTPKTISTAPIIYSVNILVTNPSQTTKYYEKVIPNIQSSTAFVIDSVFINNLQIQNSPALLQITDVTDYSSAIKSPPFLQVLVTNSRNQTVSVQFPKTQGMNILMRTATLALPTTGPTTIMVDRYKMGI